VDAQAAREARPHGRVPFGVPRQVWPTGPEDLIDAAALLEGQAAQAETSLASAHGGVRGADSHQAFQVGSVDEQVGIVDVQHLDQRLSGLVHSLGKAGCPDVQQAFEGAEVAALNPLQSRLNRPGGQRGPRGQSQLAEDALDVVGYRARAQAQGKPDLGVCLAARDQGRDLLVA
jgi:hypothetical protein